MNAVGKSVLAAIGIAAVVGGTLALRMKPDASASHVQLTSAQVAEIKPQPKSEPPKVSAPVDGDRDLPPPPDEDLEDGSGS